MIEKGVTLEHNSYSSNPIIESDRRSVVARNPVYGTRIHSTTITDAEGNSYTGVGWTEQESEKKANEKLDSGETDWD